MVSQVLAGGNTYSAEIRAHQKTMCVGLSYLLEDLKVQSSPVDIMTIGEAESRYVGVNREMTLVGKANSPSDLSLRDVVGWVTSILRLFDLDPTTGQHWDSIIVDTDRGSSARQWKIVSKSVPFVAFP